MRRVRLARALVLSLVALSVGCGEAPPVAAPARSAGPATSVRSAAIDYYRSGPTDPVVEVRVILENTHTHSTESTTILWDPEFARNFIFLRSEPPPWRTRVDEGGWGSLDTDGAIPNQFTTFRLWFAVGTYAPLEPRLRIIADGGVQIADVTARAGHLVWQVPKAQQMAFERGRLATVSGVATLIPTGEGPAFAYALGTGVTLLAAVLLGGLQAARLVGR